MARRDLFLGRERAINHNHSYFYKFKSFDFIDGVFNVFFMRTNQGINSLLLPPKLS